MLRTLLCDNHNQFLVVQDAQAISDLLKRKDHHLWLDIQAPTPEEMRMIQTEFGLHPLAIEDASVHHQRPKVDQYSNFYFVVFYSVDLYEVNDMQSPAAATSRLGLRGTRFLGMGRSKVAPPPNATYEPGSLIGTVPADVNADQPGGQLQDGPAGRENALEAISGGSRPPLMADSGAVERIILREMSMFMGRNYLITVHEHPIPELDEVARRWYRNVVSIKGEIAGEGNPPGTRPLTEAETQSLKVQDDDSGHLTIGTKTATVPGSNGKSAAPGKNGSRVSSGPDQVDEAYSKDEEEAATDVGILLYSLLDTIVDGYFPVIDTIVDRIEDLEEQIFEHFNQSAIEVVFNLKKDLLAMRKVLAPERDVLNILTRRDLPIFDQHTLVYFQDVYDHVVRITDSIDTYRDLLSSALDSYLSMQSNRLNITVQTLTSVSIMLMSIATFTGWFGMNFEFMPELHTTWGYPAVILAVGTTVFLEFLFFRRKGWL